VENVAKVAGAVSSVGFSSFHMFFGCCLSQWLCAAHCSALCRYFISATVKFSSIFFRLLPISTLTASLSDLPPTVSLHVQKHACYPSDLLPHILFIRIHTGHWKFVCHILKWCKTCLPVILYFFHWYKMLQINNTSCDHTWITTSTKDAHYTYTTQSGMCITMSCNSKVGNISIHCNKSDKQ